MLCTVQNLLNLNFLGHFSNYLPTLRCSSFIMPIVTSSALTFGIHPVMPIVEWLRWRPFLLEKRKSLWHPFRIWRSGFFTASAKNIGADFVVVTHLCNVLIRICQALHFQVLSKVIFRWVTKNKKNGEAMTKKLLQMFHLPFSLKVLQSLPPKKELFLWAMRAWKLGRDVKANY